uniref:Protein sleepless n=1 Tax=Timema monikensis TaxID=170555 RepID=A0A7R9HSX0_9NEOP|nr:unnamed protein product [Timema monikensis]
MLPLIFGDIVVTYPPDDRTIRGCGWDDSTYKGRCYQRSGFGGRQEVCSCLTDNCNGAPHVGTMPFLLGTSLLFLARCLF